MQSIKDDNSGLSEGNYHTDNDISQRSTLLRMVDMKDDLCHKDEETAITNFLQFALGEVKYIHIENVSIIHCNHIRIGNSVTENDYQIALCADTSVSKSVIGKNQMKYILDMLDRRSMPADRSNRVFRSGMCQKIH